MSSKAIMNPAQSEKDFEHDYDDGVMFFHSHNVWEAIRKLEKFYECKIYGVLELEDVVESLRDYNAFDKEYGDDDYLCEVDDVGKQLWLSAMDYAYENVNDNEYGYEAYLDSIYDYVVDGIKDAYGK